MRRNAMWALAVVALVGAGVGVAEPPPGPPWPTNVPALKGRPASDAPAKDFAVAEVEASGGPVGVGVAVRAAVAKPTLGNTYDLYYQIRVHTKKGEFGPLLATKESASGLTVLVAQVKCAYDWIEFYEKFDVTRGDLSGKLNLPAREKGGGDRDVVLRVEPQIWDEAAKVYLTATKTPAALVVASVGAAGKVWKVRSLGAWLIEQSGSGMDPKQALATLADLDEFSPESNGVDEAIATVLSTRAVASEKKALYVAAVRAETLKTLSGYNLKRTLEEFAAGPDGELKAAAKKKLEEAR